MCIKLKSIWITKINLYEKNYETGSQAGLQVPVERILALPPALPTFGFPCWDYRGVVYGSESVTQSRGSQEALGQVSSAGEEGGRSRGGTGGAEGGRSWQQHSRERCSVPCEQARDRTCSELTQANEHGKTHRELLETLLCQNLFLVNFWNGHLSLTCYQFNFSFPDGRLTLNLQFSALECWDCRSALQCLALSLNGLTGGRFQRGSTLRQIWFYYFQEGLSVTISCFWEKRSSAAL